MADEKQKEVQELQIPTSLKSLIEGLVFAAKEPLTVKQLKDIYEGDGPQSYLRQLELDEIEASISELNAEYEKGEKPYRIIQIAGGYQFATSASYSGWIGRLYKEQGRRKLSQSGVETLAIVAYKQPVTKSDIESIRGVNCDYVLKTLLEKELVTIVGRAHAPGRPLLYGTTREFLKHFGLNDITDLPRPREIEEILGESQFETERRMLEAQAGAEKMKDEEPDFKSRLPHIPKKKSELEGLVEIKSKEGQRGIKTIQKEEYQEEVPEVKRTENLEVPLSAVEPVSSVDQPGDVPTIVNDARGPLQNDSPAVESQKEPDALEPVAEVTTITTADGITSEINAPPAESPEQHPAEQSVPVAVSIETEAHAHLESEFDNATIQGVRAASSGPLENKSKWQSWKEKVQGFIKKIFG